MKITFETNLENFKAWSGAVDAKKKIIEAGKVDEFNELIEELYPEGIDATTLNDLLWFDVDWLYENLGMIEETEEE